MENGALLLRMTKPEGRIELPTSILPRWRSATELPWQRVFNTILLYLILQKTRAVRKFFALYGTQNKCNLYLFCAIDETRTRNLRRDRAAL